MTRPRVAITMGDPAGVGPEVALKALREPELYEVCRPVVFGTPAALEREPAAQSIELDSDLTRDDASPERVLVHPVSDVALPPYGEVSAEGGELAVAAVRAATEAALAGRIGALATAPLNKASMRLAGYEHAGHTELLADLCGAREVSMVLVGPQLRVAHMTTHIALEDVPGRITAERLETVVRIAGELLRRLGIDSPRLAVAGLNPHAGEGGLFGEQEQRVLVPAISRLRAAGVDVSGPLPGDTVFGAARAGRYDLVVAMYHDQGHIPIKLLHADEAVNVTGGLPIIRTSVDHGTAFDIAGQDKARSASMTAAVRLAAQLA
jgi:4-phospho-D-threonate 3-dehydrogenase / 4-phospho-D-erythronate 3-dehydrogenase